MPLGLVNAPTAFQRAMDLVLSGLSYVICLCYLDDVIVFGRDLNEHYNRLKTVLERLCEHEKLTIAAHQVSFLGHVISDSGIMPDPAKIEAVNNISSPRNIKVWWKTRVRGYAGMRICGYAGMRICGYADMRVCGYAGMRICGYADMRGCGYAGMRICGYAGMRICGYADMRVRRTGLTNRFQKLINNSNKIIAVNTKNHSCEGVFVCGKTHVDFHKTLTSIFSAYTTSIY